MVEGKIASIEGWAAMDNKSPLKLWSYSPRPLGPSDVEVKIHFCGICGSDIHAIDSGWGASIYPLVTGHEIVGKVITKGENVSNLDIGDLVGVGGHLYACHQNDCKPCSRGLDPHCPKSAFAYNSKYEDGSLSYGGFAEAIRVDSRHAFRLPENMDPELAAPLMCAGLTVFTPMVRKGVKKGNRVGVVGIGGLGHLAIQFANALGCEVIALSTSDNKEEECLKLGASQFINIKNQEEVAKINKSLDYLFITTNSKSNNYTQMAQWMTYEGTMCLLALPENNIEINPGVLVFGSIYLGGSLIGGIEDVKKTLEFAAKHNIRPMIEKMPMKNINEGIQRVRDGNVRYRIVLEN
ncbi:hypothetical protein H4219_005111 [Mycoemilia scoparia]|uniref:Enoyl reductase (ER) domain-containing protein n=1 Tax=Mycoemilia scoparia TaxID=417184 RepID=A0A9W7ZUY3_9FUNG|nr:hypothetical protein H4219_005111 [Mycoemilia scoparia]